MTATNHALTGAVIGLSVQAPLAAGLVAILSHYVLDVLPHYHSPLDDERLLKTKQFRNYLMLEAALCFLVVVILVSLKPMAWALACICAFLAAAPDLLSVNRYLKVRTGKEHRPNLYTRFAGRIQWFQRPIGGVVEAVWFVCASFTLAKLLLI